MTFLLQLFRFIVNLLIKPVPKAYQLEPLPNPLSEPQPLNAMQKERDLVTEFCLAISTYEGGPNDLNHKNNNPGNCRGMDGQFLKFKSYEQGFAYLKEYVTRACTGKHPAYKPDFTILQFFSHYAPSADNNNPQKYAEYVCVQLNIPITMKIKDLIG